MFLKMKKRYYHCFKMKHWGMALIFICAENPAIAETGK
jgi:hypothetical protein